MIRGKVRGREDTSFLRKVDKKRGASKEASRAGIRTTGWSEKLKGLRSSWEIKEKEFTQYPRPEAQWEPEEVPLMGRGLPVEDLNEVNR